MWLVTVFVRSVNSSYGRSTVNLMFVISNGELANWIVSIGMVSPSILLVRPEMAEVAYIPVKLVFRWAGLVVGLGVLLSTV